MAKTKGAKKNTGPLTTEQKIRKLRAELKIATRELAESNQMRDGAQSNAMEMGVAALKMRAKLDGAADVLVAADAFVQHWIGEPRDADATGKAHAELIRSTLNYRKFQADWTNEYRTMDQTKDDKS